MRTDIEKIAFAAAATGAVLAVIDVSDCDSFSVGVVESALGNAPTNHGYDVCPVDGANVFSYLDSYGSADWTNAVRKGMLSRYGTFGAAKTTLLPELYKLTPAVQKISISIWVTGAGGTATGVVYIFKHRI